MSVALEEPAMAAHLLKDSPEQHIAAQTEKDDVDTLDKKGVATYTEPSAASETVDIPAANAKEDHSHGEQMSVVSSAGVVDAVDAAEADDGSKQTDKFETVESTGIAIVEDETTPIEPPTLNVQSVKESGDDAELSILGESAPLEKEEDEDAAGAPQEPVPVSQPLPADLTTTTESTEPSTAATGSPAPEDPVSDAPPAAEDTPISPDDAPALPEVVLPAVEEAPVVKDAPAEESAVDEGAQAVEDPDPTGTVNASVAEDVPAERENVMVAEAAPSEEPIATNDVQVPAEEQEAPAVTEEAPASVEDAPTTSDDATVQEEALVVAEDPTEAVPVEEATGAAPGTEETVPIGESLAQMVLEEPAVEPGSVAEEVPSVVEGSAEEPEVVSEALLKEDESAPIEAVQETEALEENIAPVMEATSAATVVEDKLLPSDLEEESAAAAVEESAEPQEHPRLVVEDAVLPEPAEEPKAVENELAAVPAIGDDATPSVFVEAPAFEGISVSEEVVPEAAVVKDIADPSQGAAVEDISSPSEDAVSPVDESVPVEESERQVEEVPAIEDVVESFPTPAEDTKAIVDVDDTLAVDEAVLAEELVVPVPDAPVLDTPPSPLVAKMDPEAAEPVESTLADKPADADHDADHDVADTVDAPAQEAPVPEPLADVEEAAVPVGPPVAVDGAEELDLEELNTPAAVDETSYSATDAPASVFEPVASEVTSIPLIEEQLVDDEAPADVSTLAVEEPAEEVLAASVAEVEPVAATTKIVDDVQLPTDVAIEEASSEPAATSETATQIGIPVFSIDTVVEDEPEDAHTALPAASASRSPSLQEHPESPWTPSYSVTTQGPGTSAVEEQRITELEQLPPTVEEPVVVSPPQVEVTTEPPQQAAIEDDYSKAQFWVPSYSVSSQGATPLHSPSLTSVQLPEEVPSAAIEATAIPIQIVDVSEEPTPPEFIQETIEELTQLRSAATPVETVDETAQPEPDVQILITQPEAVDDTSTLLQEEAASDSVEADMAPTSEIPAIATEDVDAAEPSQEARKTWIPSYSVRSQGSSPLNPPQQTAGDVDVEETESLPALALEDEVPEDSPTLTTEAEPATAPITAPGVLIQPDAASTVVDQAAPEVTPAVESAERPVPTIVTQTDVDEPETPATLLNGEERPKSPWTPSYSVTQQGSRPLASPTRSTEELSEGEQLPHPVQEDNPTIIIKESSSPVVAAETHKENGIEEPPARPWTSSYSVTSQGSVSDIGEVAASIGKEVEAAPEVDEHMPEAVPDAAVNGHNLHSFPMSDEPQQVTAKPSLPRLAPVDENAQIQINESSASPVEAPTSAPRARLESTTSSRFFPGGWFSSSTKLPDDGRMSLQNATGEFARRSADSVASPSLEVPANTPIDGNVDDKKRQRWCVIM